MKLPVSSIGKSLREEFLADRGQTLEPPKPTPPTRKKRDKTPYDSFIGKFTALEESIDDFGTRDLVYYFREIANRNGFKYVISNIKKDMAIMSRLRDNYSNREICGMIEFLYESEQDYLDKARLSPNVLASQWVNTIYADMQLWVNDSYEPVSVKKAKKKSKTQREWDSSTSDDVVIGAKI